MSIVQIQLWNFLRLLLRLFHLFFLNNLFFHIYRLLVLLHLAILIVIDSSGNFLNVRWVDRLFTGGFCRRLVIAFLNLLLLLIIILILIIVLFILIELRTFLLHHLIIKSGGLLLMLNNLLLIIIILLLLLIVVLILLLLLIVGWMFLGFDTVLLVISLEQLFRSWHMLERAVISLRCSNDIIVLHFVERVIRVDP